MERSEPFKIEQIVASIQSSLQKAVLTPQSCEGANSIGYQVGALQIELPLALKSFNGDEVLFETIDAIDWINNGQRTELESLSLSKVSFQFTPNIVETTCDTTDSTTNEETSTAVSEEMNSSSSATSSSSTKG